MARAGKHCHRQHRPGDERHSVPFKKQFSQQSLEGEKPLTSWGQGNKAIKMEPHRTHMGPIFEEKQRLPQRLGWGRSHTWVSARKQLSKVIRLQKSAWVCQPGRAGSHLSPLSCSLPSTDKGWDSEVQWLCSKSAQHQAEQTWLPLPGGLLSLLSRLRLSPLTSAALGLADSVSSPSPTLSCIPEPLSIRHLPLSSSRAHCSPNQST